MKYPLVRKFLVPPQCPLTRRRKAQLGPLDAGIGLVLEGDGKGNFNPQPYTSTGLCIPGDTRALIEVKGKKYNFLVAATYGGPVQVLRK